MRVRGFISIVVPTSCPPAAFWFAYAFRFFFPSSQLRAGPLCCVLVAEQAVASALLSGCDLDYFFFVFFASSFEHDGPTGLLVRPRVRSGCCFRFVPADLRVSRHPTSLCSFRQSFLLLGFLVTLSFIRSCVPLWAGLPLVRLYRIEHVPKLPKLGPVRKHQNSHSLNTHILY